MYELVWRGREADARRVAAAVVGEATSADRGGQNIFAQYGLTVLELGLGNYQAALRSALSVYEDDAPFLGTQVLPDLVEAAARCGETRVADAALGRLADRAVAVGTPLALGLLARSRALLASDADAEPPYEEAVKHLKACRSAPQLGRAHLRAVRTQAFAEDDQPLTSLLPLFSPREQVAPVVLRDVDAVLAGRCLDPLPGSVPLVVGDPFHLVEPRNCVPDVRRIGERFLAFGGKGELRVSQAILFCGAHALRTARDVLSVSTLALDLASLLDVASCRLFLLLR